VHIEKIVYLCIRLQNKQAKILAQRLNDLEMFNVYIYDVRRYQSIWKKRISIVFLS